MPHSSTINSCIGLFCSSSDNLPSSIYAEAHRFGLWLGHSGRTLVYGGARCGLMEATARGVRDAVAEGGCGRVVGVTPQILIDQNRVSNNIDQQIVTPDLAIRKQQTLELSDIIVAMPGSLGTLDEAFSVMAANTIGAHRKKVVFWNIARFWDDLFVMLDGLQQRGLVNRPYNESMLRVDTFEALVEVLESAISAQ